MLSFDLEDWHQLVRRHCGVAGWDAPGPAFERQVEAVLALLEELQVTSTFFVLGMCAKSHPDVVREIAAAGHELACHGEAHVRVDRQTPAEFRRDVETCVERIEALCGTRPAGYRAPAFSIGRDTLWAYDILADLGFRYDSSLYDSPKLPQRIRAIPADAFLLELPSGRGLWEFPVAVWRVGGRPVPIGGGGYWRLLPMPLLLGALRQVQRTSSHPVLYFHPYECDPLPLGAALPRSASVAQRAKGAWRGAYRNAGRGRVPVQIRRVATEHPLVTYASLFERGVLRGGRTRALSQEGVLV